MKILIPNATSPRNIGDQAMLKVLLGFLKASHRSAEITIHSVDSPLYKRSTESRVSQTLYSWSVFDSKNIMVRLGRLFQIFNLYVSEKHHINIRIFKPERRLLNLIKDYKQADLIIFASGGYLRSNKGITQALNLGMQLVPFAFAKLYKSKKIVAPISFGPFAYAWQRKIVGKILHRLDGIAVRERFSYNEIKKTQAENVFLSTDLALLLTNKRIKRVNQKSVLGFTIRNWQDVDKQRATTEAYSNALFKFARKNKAIIQPIVQVDAPMYGDHDSSITRRISENLRNSGIPVLPTKTIQTVNEGIKVYSGLDILLGMRMHSNILAATQGVPFVAVSYEYKTEGIAQELGMGKYCIPIEYLSSARILKNLEMVNKRKVFLKSMLMKTLNKMRGIEQAKLQTYFA